MIMSHCILIGSVDCKLVCLICTLFCFPVFLFLFLILSHYIAWAGLQLTVYVIKLTSKSQKSVGLPLPSGFKVWVNTFGLIWLEQQKYYQCNFIIQYHTFVWDFLGSGIKGFLWSARTKVIGHHWLASISHFNTVSFLWHQEGCIVQSLQDI